MIREELEKLDVIVIMPLALKDPQEVAKVPSYFGIIEGAERYVAKVDALPDSLDDLKLAAHRSMLGRYEYLDVAEGLRVHALAVIALGKKLNKPQETISGYSSLARSYADKLHPDSASYAASPIVVTASPRFPTRL